jgi:HPt (histidine-containing phosphotransfer) domain-containing protein
LLSRAIGGKDLTAVGAVAHKLKGSCGNIGAEGLVALCQQLEAAGKANRVRELPGLLRQVQREFEDVNQALHQIKEGSSVAEGMRGKLA